MGYNSENAHATASDVLVFDLETAPLANAADYLDPVTAARNLKDPEKIKADIAEKTVERAGKLGLDWNVGRIVALGTWIDRVGVAVTICQTEDQERAALECFWSLAKHRTLVGFNIKGFDLRFLVQRSRYLGVSYPVLDLGKYAKGGIRDLYLDLTFGDGQYDNGAMRRTLHAFARRFGLPVEDGITGADIAALVAAGNWDGVTSHVISDVELTLALARRLGVVRADVMSEVA